MYRILRYTACTLAHGTGWSVDPQYSRLRRAIDAASTPSELAVRQPKIYGEIGEWLASRKMRTFFSHVTGYGQLPYYPDC